jgi:hypothetical protein
MQFCKDNGLLTVAPLEEAQIDHPCRSGITGDLFDTIGTLANP